MEGSATMLQGWRYKIRDAERIFQQGELERAARLLTEQGLDEFLPGRKLLEQVGRSLVERGCQRILSGRAENGWRDLDAARTLVGENSQWQSARRLMAERTQQQVRRQFDSDQPAAVLETVRLLDSRGMADENMLALQRAAEAMLAADALWRRAKFTEAEERLADARRLQPDSPLPAEKLESCRRGAEQAAVLQSHLRESLLAENWEAAAAAADELLEMAPDYTLARDARRRALGELNVQRDADEKRRLTQAWSPSEQPRRPEPAATVARSPVSTFPVSASPDSVVERNAAQPRFLLWIDAVGGYLVCLGNQVTLGQSHASGEADVPILGDLSRRHALLRREGESYLLEPLAAVSLNGRPADELTILADGDELQLGAVKLMFRQPHPLSATARLELTSRHRTHPRVDAVLLMAESCVLGPDRQSHVLCRHWTDDVVLYRQAGEIHLRSMQPMEIDGKLHDGRGRLAPHSRVLGENFSLSVEPLS